MRFLIQIKAWQLFLLLFFFPFLINGLSVGLFGSADPAENRVLHTTSLLLPMVSIYLAWLWVLGKGFYLRSQHRASVGSFGLFKMSLIYSFIYNAYSIIFVLPILLENPQFQLAESSSVLLRIVDVLSTFAWFYSIYFVARGLVVSDEALDEAARFFGILKYVLCFAVYPIGLWFIQPKVNKVFSSPDKGQYWLEV